MTDLTRLRVSLTKNGAHKIAYLLLHFPVDQVLDNLDCDELSIHIDGPQAKKNLSLNQQGKPHDVWLRAQEQGSEIVYALTMLALIFSHHQLIEVMASSRAETEFRGRLQRGNILGNKAFTNFKYAIQQLGFSVRSSADYVDYDFSSLFAHPELASLVAELLEIKLRDAKWNGQGSPLDEMIQYGFHHAISMNEDTFRNWLSENEIPIVDLLNAIDMTADDVDFYAGNDNEPLEHWQFAPGHNERLEGRVGVQYMLRRTSMSLLHNRIQNSLYSEKVAQFGSANVGTEQSGVDLVVLNEGEFWFYEIKTASTAKACIRQALSQLMEYAYWPAHERANRLIIVSQNELDSESFLYLQYLRQRFEIPIYYESHMVQS